MKTNRFLTFPAILIALAFIFSSCSSDGGDGGDPGPGSDLSSSSGSSGSSSSVTGKDSSSSVGGDGSSSSSDDGDPRTTLVAGTSPVNVAYDATSASATFTGATGLTLSEADFEVSGGLSFNVGGVSGGTVTVTVVLSPNPFNTPESYVVSINSGSTKIKGTVTVTIIQAANPSGIADERVELSAGIGASVAFGVTTANVTFTGAGSLTTGDLATTDFTTSNGATIGGVSVLSGTVTVTVNFGANSSITAVNRYTVGIAAGSIKVKGNAEVSIVQAIRPAYTVTFNSNGGTAVASINNVPHGSTITVPTSPTKSGYGLGGWYKEPTLENEWNFGTDNVTVTTTLYAKWDYDGSLIVGDVGPGGGIVFYVAPLGFKQYTSATDDVGFTAHYLEAAPANTSNYTRYWCSCDWSPPSGCIESGGISGTATAIGTGRKNTALIIAHPAHTGEEDYNVAAKGAYNYTTAGASDWFLPSMDELNELYLQKNTLGIEISTGLYWTSTQYNAYSARYQDFSDGNQMSQSKGQNAYVRPIRAF
jgi:hypothetical protein